MAVFERSKIPTFIFASECICTTHGHGIFLQRQEGKVCFFHHTFKSELSLQAWGEQLALGFTHFFLKNTSALSKYAHFITNITRDCTLMVVHIYLPIYQYYCWKVERRNAEEKKRLLPVKVKI